MSSPMKYQSQDKFEHQTIEQSVVQRLQAAITQGHLVPGQKLVYSEIAEDMNVSVTPVREAMKTLQALGLVTIRPHRTAFVSYLTEDQVEQLYALRTLLEGLATQRTVERITDAEISHLKQVYEEMDGVVEVLNRVANDIVRSEGIVSLQRLHNDFHSSLYASCGNQYLDQTIRLLRSQVATYWPVINRYSIQRVNKSHSQHFGILSACEQHKPLVTARLMRTHLQETVPWIIEHIRTGHPQAGEAEARGMRDITTTEEFRFRQDAELAVSEDEK